MASRVAPATPPLIATATGGQKPPPASSSGVKPAMVVSDGDTRCRVADMMIATIAIAATWTQVADDERVLAIVLPVMVAAIGLVASLIGIVSL